MRIIFTLLLFLFTFSFSTLAETLYVGNEQEYNLVPHAALYDDLIQQIGVEDLNDVTWQDVDVADMIDYYVKLVGADHVGIASDDLFTTAPIVAFAKANADNYDDDGYMFRAFDKGATGCGELSKILAAATDELWKRGFTNEDLKKIFGGNKMRVYKQVWEGESSVQFNKDAADTEKLRNTLKERYITR